MRPLLALLLLGGCEWVRLPLDEGVYDADGDGYTSLDDCDDFNDNVFPSAQERCNGVDNNCSGTEDDAMDASLWYPDIDGDGYGDPAQSMRACDAPLGYVSGGWDCDDGDDAVHPGAAELDCVDPRDYNCDGFPAGWDSDFDGSPDCQDCRDDDDAAFPGAAEICNGLDDDCDGTADEDLPGATWYADADGDGWGDPAVAVTACDRPAGYAADGTDCDDADAAVHPAAAEACDGADQDCDGEIDEPDRFGNDRWYADADGDGYGDPLVWVGSCDGVSGYLSRAEDCDDADPAIHPAASEACDGVDEDCDGTVDEDAIDPLPFYRDADRDGWGDEAVVSYACTAPSGYVDVIGDCDDGDDDVSPDGAEVCGGVDEDCDGETDDDDASGGTPWYVDADGDGYGSDATIVLRCSAPAGRIATGGDCDDTDPVYHPDALEIDCADRSDYNCDGSVGRNDADGDGWYACQDCDDRDDTRNPAAAESCDAEDDDCDGDVDEDATDGAAWYTDADGDGYGDDASAELACEAPGGAVAVGGDCDDAAPLVNPGEPEDCATADDDDCDGDTNLDGIGCADWYVDGDGDGFGSDESACLCVPEDPYVAAVALDCDDAEPVVNPGAAETCGNGVDDDCDDLAPGCGVAGEMSLADADAKLVGGRSRDQLGLAMALGDLDGDGISDLLVSVPGDDTGAADAGAAFLVAGPFAGGLGAADVAETWYASGASDGAGSALAAGDLDGDGVSDLVVGVPYDDAAGTSAGRIYAVRGPLTGGPFASADGAFTGTDAADQAGRAVVMLADTDGDGTGELAVGAPRESSRSLSAGAVYVFGALPAGAGTLDGASDALLAGDSMGDFFGYALTGAGDFDGDGIGDLAVGAYGDDVGAANAGAVYVFYGPFSGTLSVSSADGLHYGTGASEAAGYAVAGGEDIDRDGLDDLVVGAFNAATSGLAAGAVYVVHGPATGTTALGGDATLLGETASDALGTSLALGDLDQDGFADIAMRGMDMGRGGGGAVWVAFGPVAGTSSVTDAEAVLYAEDTDDEVGTSLAIGADSDGDGFPELFVGAPGEDAAGTDAGAVYVIGGGPGL